MLRAVSAAALLVSLACASSPPVAVDALGRSSVKEAATFALLPTPDAGGDPAYGPTARRAAHEAVRAGLTDKGLRETEPAEADLLIRVTTRLMDHAAPPLGVGQRHDVYRRRAGLRTPVGDVPLAESTVSVPGRERRIDLERERLDRHVLVEVTERGSDEPAWRGSTRMRGERMSLSKLRSHLAALIDRFPDE